MDRRDRVPTLGAMIEVNAVVKAYRRVPVLKTVSFQCQPGRVTGLLGPNGAGKSTLMRIMVGLTTPDAGAVTFSGVPYRELPSPGRHVGVMLDASAQHGGRTGAEVLRLGTQALGLPTSRIGEVLDLVGLTVAESRRRVKAYSLGMRQRLGIAHALLAEPPVLIFDEPANGLDPSGIRWIRTLLSDHARAGGTVLLSSHLINEIELVADDLVLIGEGAVLATGSKAELIDRRGQVSTRVAAVDPAGLRDALLAADLEVHANGSHLTVQAETRVVGEIAARNQLVLTELGSVTHRLEDEFFRVTDGTAREHQFAGAASAAPAAGPVSNNETKETLS